MAYVLYTGFELKPCYFEREQFNDSTAILSWLFAALMKTKTQQNVQIDNFSTSWNDGMAFCALIHHYYPDAFDFNELQPKNRAYNFTLAFKTAE